MDRNPACLYKTLTVGVIVLFFIVGVQPAFADDVPNLEKENNDIEKDLLPNLQVRIAPQFEGFAPVLVCNYNRYKGNHRDGKNRTKCNH